LKKISREYESVTRPLERHLPALPLDQILNGDEEMKQLQAWKRYILWEKQNPLKLDSQQEIMKRGLLN
jgi:cleavage stimulation factor subunit 3